MHSITTFFILVLCITEFTVQPLPLSNTVKRLNTSVSQKKNFTGVLTKREPGYSSGNHSNRNRNTRNPKANKDHSINDALGNHRGNTGNSRGNNNNDRTSANDGSRGPTNSTSSVGSLQFHFKNGQCTDWADARYAQLTGYHVSWSGDALTWPSKARNYAGWTVSNQAKTPSIISIQPGFQGVGNLGHVAVVERINPDGSVYTSNYNYNGGPYVLTFVTFQVGTGVGFMWHN
ncbi:hypothetical protein K7432_005993 [Basidiobolus ranarum]|uniref:Peptidase C51 domain-containing protein n=1 Tax=Basidiobolus ranarum TaxID=34480 RepID=A0ABR2WVV2_9FUNG